MVFFHSEKFRAKWKFNKKKIRSFFFRAEFLKVEIKLYTALITYSIFHTKNTKAQEEICFIVRTEAEKVFSYPSEQATDPGSSTVSTSTHTRTPSLQTPQIQVTSSPHRSPIITSPPLSPPRHTFSTSRQPVRSSVRIKNQHRSQSQS